MKRIMYPAIFHKEDESEGYYVTFPDFEHVFTQGKTIEECYDMSIDALYLAMTGIGKINPKPSALEDIQCEKGSFVVLIDFDIEEYARRMKLKSVKKTLTIPGWLNEAAIAAGINFSEVLKKALKQELGL